MLPAESVFKNAFHQPGPLRTTMSRKKEEPAGLRRVLVVGGAGLEPATSCL